MPTWVTRLLAISVLVVTASMVITAVIAAESFEDIASSQEVTEAAIEVIADGQAQRAETQDQLARNLLVVCSFVEPVRVVIAESIPEGEAATRRQAEALATLRQARLECIG